MHGLNEGHIAPPWRKHLDIIIMHLLYCVCCFQVWRLALCALTLPSLRKSECHFKVTVFKYILMIQIKSIPEKNKAVREAKHPSAHKSENGQPINVPDAPSHYPNQCWFLINEVLWHSSESNIPESSQAIILYNVFENHAFKITSTFTRGQWVK